MTTLSPLMLYLVVFLSPLSLLLGIKREYDGFAVKAPVKRLGSQQKWSKVVKSGHSEQESGVKVVKSGDSGPDIPGFCVKVTKVVKAAKTVTSSLLSLLRKTAILVILDVLDYLGPVLKGDTGGERGIRQVRQPENKPVTTRGIKSDTPEESEGRDHF